MNLVFVFASEKVSWFSRVTSYYSRFRKGLLQTLAVSTAAVFLLLAASNTEFSYNGESGDLTFSTSLFGKSEDGLKQPELPPDK